MNAVLGHLTKCFVAGLVALLPIGGMVLLVMYLEASISKSWLAEQEFYFPGAGLLAVVLIVYAIGLLVSTFLGRWIFRKIDALLHALPALGRLYGTLKEILGYGQGKEAMFHEVVLVKSVGAQAEELGLVTKRVKDASGAERLVVFVPGAPNPTSGRLLLLDPRDARPLALPVNEALKALVTVGKSDLSLALREENAPPR